MAAKKPIYVAYFSMEFAFVSEIPNYAGGLGVLAADMMHGFADQDYPGVGVSLIYHQDDDPKRGFDPSPYMKRLKETVQVKIEGRPVTVGVYQYDVQGIGGATTPVYFLTTNLPENEEWDRDLTKWLYSADTYTRLAQEVILGVGGVRMLRALGYEQIDRFHMNEGHSAFLTLELLKEHGYQDAEVRKVATFTTHTPVKAGHDHFDYDLAKKVLGQKLPWHIQDLATKHSLSMTHLAMNLSEVTNSVSERHREVCQGMFPGFEFENVTNGVHHPRWVSESMGKLFDKHLKGWREQPELFQNAMDLPEKALLEAHRQGKKALVEWVNENQKFFNYCHEMHDEDYFDEDTLTIGFARRFVPYKRPGLIFKDLKKLRCLGYRKIQMIFGGKCHPNDEFCNLKVGDIRRYAEELRGQIRVAVVPDYNLDIAKRLVTGVDVWLNNPIKPREASGTSGMKAALNGVLNLSVLDGWWIEGHRMQPQAGWGFGDRSDELPEKERDSSDAAELYDCLGDAVECYYERPEEWAERMKAAISLLSFFNVKRCVSEYSERVWGRTEER